MEKKEVQLKIIPNNAMFFLLSTVSQAPTGIIAAFAVIHDFDHNKKFLSRIFSMILMMQCPPPDIKGWTYRTTGISQFLLDLHCIYMFKPEKSTATATNAQKEEKRDEIILFWGFCTRRFYCWIWLPAGAYLEDPLAIQFWSNWHLLPDVSIHELGITQNQWQKAV